MKKDLGKEPEFGCKFSRIGGEAQRINGMNDIKHRQQLADFVALNTANEMPTQGRRQLGDFHRCLLLTAFSKPRLSRRISFTDEFGGNRLGNGN